ncbi:MAG: glutamine amidotransferase [Rhodoferax sp.]|nr:glutamine amidotransferase [Rhodoferax sp.]
MQCLAIRHLAFEDLGSFEPVLQHSGFAVEYRNAGVQSLDTADWLSADLLVVLGGPVGVYDSADYPWLRDEIAGLESRIRRDLPTLGICLGAQLIAAALGASVYAGPAREIGWSTLQLTAPGHASCLRALERVEVLHWHGDTFALPKYAVPLASTALTANQAFAYGHGTLALQFHPEVWGDQLEPWLIGHTVELRQAGVDIQTLRSRGALNADLKAAAGQEMLRNWLFETGLCP